MDDNTQIEALRAQVDHLTTTVAALTAAPTSRSYDDSVLVERIDALAAQVAKAKQDREDTVTRVASQLQAQILAKVNKSLHGSLDAITTEIVAFEGQVKTTVEDSKRQLENQVADASSAMLRLASMQELTAKAASDRIAAWLAEL